MVAYADATGKPDATSIENANAAMMIPLADRTKTGAGDQNAALKGRLAKWIASVNNDLFQPDGGPGSVKRGSFSPATNTIALLKNADLSTFLHESTHFPPQPSPFVP